MALILLAASDPPITLSAVRLEAENGRPVVRAVLSGSVRARVERDGRDLALVLPGARAADGLRLPGPVAEIQSLSLEDSLEGARIVIRLESALPHVLSEEGGVVSLTIRAAPGAAPHVAPSAPPHVAPDRVRDLYARILPPPESAPAAPPPPVAEETTPGIKAEDSGGLRLGFIRLRPWVAISYVDAQTSFLDTPAPVRDQYLQIDPHIGFAVGGRLPLPGQGRFLLTYEPRFRLSSSYEELSKPTHLATGEVDVPIGAFVTLRAAHHYAKGFLETTEVDPGREYFFDLAPFTRHQTRAGLTVSSGSLLNVDVSAMRDSVNIEETGAFFDHRVESISSRLNYEMGANSRAFLRYDFMRVPPAETRPIVESQAHTLSIGVAGELTPLLSADVTVGFTSLSAPQAAIEGRRYRGSTLTATLRKEFTPSASVTLLGNRGTYPSGFEENAFYIATGAGVGTDLGLPLSFVFHGGAGWQRNSYRVPAAGLSVPRQDEIWDWSAGIGRSLTRWSFLRADYRYERRDSNLPAFQTDGHLFMVQLGIGYVGAAPTGVVTR